MCVSWFKVNFCENFLLCGIDGLKVDLSVEEIDKIFIDEVFQFNGGVMLLERRNDICK